VYNASVNRFSLCYPAEWKATVSPEREDIGQGGILSLQDAGGSLSFVVYWAESSPFELGLYKDRCEAVDRWDDVRAVTLNLNDRSVEGCEGYEPHHAPELGPVLGTHAEIPLGGGRGYIVVTILRPENLSSAAADELSSALGSLRISQ
jgi:hypothetical protein